MTSKRVTLMLLAILLLGCITFLTDSATAQVTAFKSPSRAPTRSSPTKSPIVSKPTKSPTTSRPSKSPFTSRPSLSPTPPTYRPTKSPTRSSPTKSPVVSKPTRSPVTSRPTSSPIIGPCEKFKGAAGCRASLADCGWVTKTLCPSPKAPKKQCKTFNYGCRSALQPFCTYRSGTTKQRLQQCASNPNCLWAGSKLGCQINWGVEFTRSPSSKPTTLQPTTLQPTTLKPTTKSPTSLSPTTRSPTTKKPTTARPSPSDEGLCYDGCYFANFDNECDDGRPGSVTPLCPPGSDCSDCGPYFP